MRTNSDYFTEVQPADFIMGIVRVYLRQQINFYVIITYISGEE